MQAVNGTFFKVLFCCPNNRPIGEGARIYYKSCGLLFCLSPAYYIWIGGPKIEKTQDSSPKAKRRYQPSAPFFHWQNRLYGVSVSHRLIDVQPAGLCRNRCLDKGHRNHAGCLHADPRYLHDCGHCDRFGSIAAHEFLPFW